MFNSGIYLTLLVWCVSVSGTIIFPTRGNHRTCKLLNCPQGTKCKQEVRQCASPPCQQPPPTCIKVSTPSQPTLCPPGLNPDLHMGRTKNCVSDGQCGFGSKCFSANVHGPFICCTERPTQAILPSQSQYKYPPPHHHHPSAPQLAIQPLQHPGPQHNPPIPRINAPQQPMAHQPVINQKQPPQIHYQHGPPNQPLAQPHRQAIGNIQHQHQSLIQQPAGQVRHHTLAQPQAKPYAFMNHQPSQHFHQSHNRQPSQYQTRNQEYNAEAYLQSEPINQPQSNTQRGPMSRRYPDPWNRHQREPEIEVANPPAPEVEVRSAPPGYGPTSSQNCPVGHLPDYQRGQEIPCIQDSQCQSGSHCMSGTGRRYVCCARETSGRVQPRPVENLMPRYDTNRKQIVSYGNRRLAPRLSFPLPSETLPVVNDLPHWQHPSNQQRQPDRISFNSQYSPNKQPNVPYIMPGSNIQPRQQPNNTSVPGQTQVTCPSGYTANQVNGQNMVCASGSQCPEGSECKSTGLFQGSICCSKPSGMGQNMGYRPRR